MPFKTPDLDADDDAVLEEISRLRLDLRHNLAPTHRWLGTLARQHRARAVRGSNSIEGIDVSEDKALAIEVDEEELTTVDDVWLAVKGYSDAMTYARVLGDDPARTLDMSTLLSMHFMVQGHDLSKSPGEFRRRDVYVEEENTGRIVYEGPDADKVPDLVAELLHDVDCTPAGVPPLVVAAMAHLNLVMIHPFRDGNGRLSRILQSAILYRERVAEAEFVSVEEYLGRNTLAYYDVLAQVGGGRWQPHRSAHSWIEFMLTAHYRQATTVQRRVEIMNHVAARADDLLERHGFHERSLPALESTLSGWRLTNARYREDAGVTAATASRDLRALCRAGVLERQGEKRGSWYMPTEEHRSWLAHLQASLREKYDSSVDPYAVLRREGHLPPSDQAGNGR